MSYVFYPGCSLESTAKEYALSTRAVCDALGIDMPELDDWTCCGSTAAHQTEPAAGAGLAGAKNLAAAAGNTVAVACAACYSRLKLANHEIAGDAQSRAQVAERLAPTTTARRR